MNVKAKIFSRRYYVQLATKDLFLSIFSLPVDLSLTFRRSSRAY
jgi:hypothetical protein